MPIELQDKGRDYKRLQHTPDEQQRINRAGYTTVLSSNVSAIATYNGDLFIRFHGGSSYIYPGSGDLYEPMLNSSSKGKFVWRELRRKAVPYQRIANIRIPNDVEDRDMNLPRREIINQVTDDFIADIAMQNEDIVKELLRSNINPKDIKTLITSDGIYQQDATTINTILQNPLLVLNEIDITKIFALGIIAL